MIIIVFQALKTDIFDDILFVRILQYSTFSSYLLLHFCRISQKSNTLNSFKLLYMGQTTTISADISLAGQNASHKFLAS